MEADFVAQNSRNYEYFPITADCSAKERFKREIAPIRKIKGNYKRTVLALDNFTLGNY